MQVISSPNPAPSWIPVAPALQFFDLAVVQQEIEVGSAYHHAWQWRKTWLYEHPEWDETNYKIASMMWAGKRPWWMSF